MLQIALLLYILISDTLYIYKMINILSLINYFVINKNIHYVFPRLFFFFCFGLFTNTFSFELPVPGLLQVSRLLGSV